MEAIDRIIWSADVEDEEALMAALELMPELRIIKLDALFFEDRDLSTIDRVSELGVQVFDDRKGIEIPSKLEAIAKKHCAHKPWMLNCMAHGLSSGIINDDDPDMVDGLKRFADVCHAHGVLPCAVTVLTSKTPGIVSREFNGRDSFEQVLYYAERLVDFGFTDMVCSPVEVEVIRTESRFDDLRLNTPGIRPEWAAKGDQARIGTPSGALATGADRLVIGRAITEGVPSENLARIVEEIKAAA